MQTYTPEKRDIDIREDAKLSGNNIASSLYIAVLTRKDSIADIRR